jgi:hydroxyacylglutathione hydrolase
VFVQTVARQLPKPVYFEKMEMWNLAGVPALPLNPGLTALAPAAFRDRLLHNDDIVAVDLRGMAAYMGGHIHGALSIPLDSLPSYIGWFVAPEQPVLLIPDRNDDVEKAAIYLNRQGYDNIVGYLADGMAAWLMDDLPITYTPWLSPNELKAQMGSEMTLLDVRAPFEAETGMLPDALVVPHKQLLQEYHAIPVDKQVVAYCVAGPRSVAVVSVLEHRGYENLGVLSGGILAWRQAGFDLQ